MNKDDKQPFNKGDTNMNAVISLDKARQEKYDEISSYSLLELILDAKKKKEYDQYCQNTYSEIKKDDFVKRMYDKNQKG
jgi:hypothetical protein